MCLWRNDEESAVLFVDEEQARWATRRSERPYLVRMSQGLVEHAPLVAELAAELEGGLDRLVDGMFAVLAQDPDLLGLLTPEYARIGRAIARADLLDELRALGRGGDVPDACPPAVVETARRTADLGVAVTVPIQCYRAGHQVLWRAWQRAVAARVAPPGLAEAGSDFFFAYADRCCALLLREFELYRDAALRSRDRTRLNDVRQVLDGRRDAFDSIDYALAPTHVAFVVVDQDGETTPKRGAHRTGGASLLARVDASTAWGWAPTFADPELAGDLRGTVGVGHPGAGPEGFRRSHRQAQRALGVALRSGALIARYENVALESLAGADDRALADFVDQELAGLDEPRRARAPLRETLLALFGESDSLAATARRLSVHERTVSYRIRVAEERLGRRLSARRAELETALRLEPILRQPRREIGRQAQF